MLCYIATAQFTACTAWCDVVQHSAVVRPRGHNNCSSWVLSRAGASFSGQVISSNFSPFFCDPLFLPNFSVPNSKIIPLLSGLQVLFLYHKSTFKESDCSLMGTEGNLIWSNVGKSRLIMTNMAKCFGRYKGF